MALVNALLSITDFRSPLARTIVPSIASAVTLQTLAAVPSVTLQTECLYDLAGSLTFISVGALSLFLPSLRAARAVGGAASVAASFKFPSLIAPFKAAITGEFGGSVLNWRQILLTGLVTVWATRLGSYLFMRALSGNKDSRFDKIKPYPAKFSAVFVGQAAWATFCLMPVLALNSVPGPALAMTNAFRPTDALGLAIWAGGFACEVIADTQKSRWLHEKRTKQHEEEFLTRGLFGKSRFPHYFGEITVWVGIATVAAGVLARKPVQLALGFSGGLVGILTTTGLSFISPAFSALLLLKVSGVPLSEKKYDAQYSHRKDYQEWKKNTPKLIPKFW